MEQHTPPGRFGLNVGRFEAAFPRWRLAATNRGHGFSARRLVNRRRSGPAQAATLDELATLVQAQEGDQP